MNDNPQAEPVPGAAPDKMLSPAARRALAEAEERRAAQVAAPRPKEINGREGPEPVRYGDWENKGIASDF
ncbi:DUF1674 domain-containing protein [Methylovirgula sp. 4M-Z18]|uniref:DUF1674 domain-containing protein n=1 Tax=Methylovirgula sp. 4M-Z18 TaxID=2293567 RepID=UPI000E2EC610|nr:succinate dehydrogenase assembly factor 4 [Methylovirgula sp. 4M-Z18]RFB78217.1 DUF1674 domain-containing protein [Methylovirgula sp. 4M-Z18]